MVVAVVMSLMMAVLGFGCASASKSECPSVEEEVVSICRARERCNLKKTNYSVGPGLSGQASENLGLMHERSLTTKIYMDCVDKDLEQQKTQYQIMQDEKKIIDK